MNKKLENYITVKEVDNISKELKFQREYYNYKCKHEEDTLEIANYYDKRTGLALGEELALLIEDITGNKIERNQDTEVPKNLSKEVLKNIEEPKIVENKYNQKKKEVKTLNNYYLIIYYMLKLYGFLDEYEIFKLLNKYNIKPKNEKMEKQVEVLKKVCNEEYKKKKPLEFNYYNIVFRREYVIEFCNEYRKGNYLILGQENIERYEKGRNPSAKFDKIRKHIKEKYKLLSEVERKVKSLELHKPTNFLDDLINDKINIITYDTMLNIMEDIELINTDIYYLLSKVVDEQRREEVSYKGNRRRIKLEDI